MFPLVSMKKLIFLFLCIAGLPLQAQSFDQLHTRSLNGDSAAMVLLAEKFQFGDGVTASEDSANYWISKAAGKKHPEAMYLLGIRNCSQIYSAKDFSKGMEWLNKSADLGNPKAMIKLYEIWSDKSSDDESAKYNNLPKGFAYLKRAADAGDTEGIHVAAEAYGNGRGVTRSDSTALALFSLNAEKNRYIPSRIRKADFLLEGRGLSQPDYYGALDLYKSVRFDPVSGTDSKAIAEIGIHRVDQVLKKAQALHAQGHIMLPAYFFTYRLRE
jgi:TPR repeat protein